VNKFLLNALFLIGLTVGLAQSNVPNNPARAVLFVPQTLTVAQSLQALKNQRIGVNSSTIGQVLVSTGTATAPTWQAVGAVPGVTICDAKSGFQPADHGGWIAMNGRAKNTLTATQQTAATSCGFGINIPDATGRGFTQGILATQIGSSTITQANIPSYSLVGGNHSHSVSDPGHSHASGTPQIGTRGVASGSNYNVYSSSGNFSGFSSSDILNGGIANATTGISIGASGALSISSGGSGTAYTPASIGVNQFVYLGL
jgi:hypothetical protein